MTSSIVFFSELIVQSMSHSRESTSSAPLLFYLDKSNNFKLRQCCDEYPNRLFHDGKCLIRMLRINQDNGSSPLALVLKSDRNSIENILRKSNNSQIKTLIFCPDSNRETYESLINENPSFSTLIFGFFTDVEDLRIALDQLIQRTSNERQLFRLISNQMYSYFSYEFLKKTALQIEFNAPSNQNYDLSLVNRRLEHDPLLSFYNERAALSHFLSEKPSNKKIFYGTTIKKTLLEQIQSNLNNLICFNSFVQLQGYPRSLDARHQVLQCCSRRTDEVAVIFELESANQSVFRVIRVFRTDEESRIFIVQLIGTDEYENLSNQFSQTKTKSYSNVCWQQPEILFGLMLIEMNEIEKSRKYFFELLVKQHHQLNQITRTAYDLWARDGLYLEVVDRFASKLNEIRYQKKQFGKEFHLDINQIYLDPSSDTSKPISSADVNKIKELRGPISFMADEIFYLKEKKYDETTPTSQCCTIL